MRLCACVLDSLTTFFVHSSLRQHYKTTNLSDIERNDHNDITLNQIPTSLHDETQHLNPTCPDTINEVNYNINQPSMKCENSLSSTNNDTTSTIQQFFTINHICIQKSSIQLIR